VTSTGTGRKQQHSISDEIDATSCFHPLEKELEQTDLRLLADFFLLLDKWDTLQSTRTSVEPSSSKREAA
jgi:hypothetical protein